MLHNKCSRLLRFLYSFATPSFLSLTVSLPLSFSSSLAFFRSVHFPSLLLVDLPVKVSLPDSVSFRLERPLLSLHLCANLSFEVDEFIMI